jgi:hypothetical protein
MKLSPQQLLEIILGIVAYGVLAWAALALVPQRYRVFSRYGAVAAGAALYFYGVQRYVNAHAIAVDWAKSFIACAAAACVFYEKERAARSRPIAERWKRFAGVSLGVAAIVAYFNGLKFEPREFYHRHDQFHYYLGAKFFPELGYDGLYKCALIAQDELGVVTYTNEATGRQVKLDMTKEARHPDRKLRNLSGDNLLMPASEFFPHAEECTRRFSPERWAAFKEDVSFFRTQSDKGYWEGMQKDHGYNPPPVWTLGGKFFAELFPPGERILGFMWVQYLAMLDILYLGGMFVALYWAFGWRVFAVAAVFWGCQSSAPYLWTGGAFLRQDWLFYLVLSTCLLRKRYFALAGASLVYSGLLRIFPGIVALGGLTIAGFHLVRHKRMAPHHLRMLLGGLAAAALLVGASLKVVGKDSFHQFYKHTLQVHDQTPLTNHMGLRVLVGQKTPIEINERIGPVRVPGLKIGVGVQSGRMKYTQDSSARDPFHLWKRLRNERNADYRWLSYGVIAATFGLFVYVCRRIRSLWVAQCLAQIFIILLSQLTCYYYSFLVLSAPLTRLTRRIHNPWLGLEVPLFLLAAVSQGAWRGFNYNDDKYWILTACSLLYCYYALCVLAGRFPWQRAVAPAQEP